ncbi:MAG: tetratricopeptide repeat protein [Deltaproteobacteria bacterium]|nr:tetratricopeptide repeat protein [Deltaproteobacteria bacterium]
MSWPRTGCGATLAVAGLTVALTVGGELPQAAAKPAPALVRAERLIAEWRYEEAEAEVAAAVKATPRDPHAIFLDGHVRFLRGDYEGAVARIREAVSLSRGTDEWKGLRDLVQATERATKGFVRTETDHFVFRHAPGKDAVLVPYAADALEKAWARVGEDLGYRPPVGTKIRVELYAEAASLAQVSTLTEREIRASGTIALCKFNRLMVVSPRALERGYPWLDTLVHEYTHLVVSRASRNSVPIWLHEGIAKFEERRWRAGPGGGLSAPMEHLLAQALKRNALIPFERMHPSMAKLPSQEDAALAFAEVYTMVEYLHAQKGYAGLRRLVEAMRDGGGEERAIHSATGMSLEELQRGWRRHLRDLGLKTRPGFVHVNLTYRKPGGKKRGADAEIAAIPEERARRHARLGGLLRARRRLLAAATEYQRALALVGREDPVLANRLARTYLEMGDPARALAAAEPAIALYPDLPGPHVTAAEAALKRGDLPRAAGRFQAALGLSPFDPAVHCGLREVYQRQGQATLAEREQRFCAQLGGEEE